MTTKLKWFYHLELRQFFARLLKLTQIITTNLPQKLTRFYSTFFVFKEFLGFLSFNFLITATFTIVAPKTSNLIPEKRTKEQQYKQASTMRSHKEHRTNKREAIIANRIQIQIDKWNLRVQRTGTLFLYYYDVQIVSRNNSSSSNNRRCWYHEWLPPSKSMESQKSWR